MASPSTSYFPITSDPLINGMTTGYFWLLDSTGELDFSISDGFGGEYWNSPTSVATYFGAALETVSVYANIDFNYLGYYTDPLASVSWGSELNLSLSQTGNLFNSNNIWARGFFPNSAYDTSFYRGAPGDIYLNMSSAANTLPSYEPGSQGWFLILHELLHTLGLKHPHDDGGTGRPTFAQLGIEWLDKDWATVMSYNDDGSWNEFFWDPATPMILDVLALQYLYGKNLTHNTGDSTYNLSETNYYYTLWDAGGADTLDASGASVGWDIFLPEISISTLVDTRVGIASPIGLSAQTLVWLAGDYENVIGSQFGDVINGNLFDNFLDGGSGHDIMYGGDGNDTFDWNAAKRFGNDTMYGGLGDDTYVLDNINDSVVESLGEGSDIIFSNFTYSLTAAENVEGLSLFGTSNINATGNSLSNFLTGNSGNNFFIGNAGLDTFIFSANGNGVDTISDISAGEIIKVNGASFNGSAAEGNGSSLGLNQIQVSRNEGMTTLNIGTDSNSGADIKILLMGSYSASQFVGSGQNITFSANVIDASGSETLTGTHSNETFRGGLGDDVIDGGAGLDYAIFAGLSSQYSIQIGSNTMISDGESGRDGTDSLMNVERLIFADTNIALDLEGIAGQAYRIYEAVLGRAPDLKGLGYWINDMDNGISLTTIAQGFIASSEFQGKYGANPSYETYINLLYNNILGRAPDTAGMNYWVSNMQRGIDSPAAVLASFSEGSENTANVAPDIANGIYYTAWIA